MMMKLISSFFTLLIIISCNKSKSNKSNNFGLPLKVNTLTAKPSTFMKSESNDGSDMKHPIPIASTVEESNWISEKFPGCTCINRTLRLQNGKFILEVQLRNKNKVGLYHYVYFDVSNADKKNILASIPRKSTSTGDDYYIEHPESYIDKGACPFECCKYGKWRARSGVVLYEQKNTNSNHVATILTNEVVTAITGDVHTIPGKVIVDNNAEINDIRNGNYRYQNGDIIYVYTYSGEGVYKLWFKGYFFYDYPPESKTISAPMSIWWIKIKTKDGITGWTNCGGEFDGTDDCDQPILPIE